MVTSGTSKSKLSAYGRLNEKEVKTSSLVFLLAPSSLMISFEMIETS